MSRKKHVEMWGVFEVAKCLDVAPQNLSGKNAPVGMPEPVQELKATRLWVADEIRAFSEEFQERRKKYRPGRYDDAPVAA